MRCAELRAHLPDYALEALPPAEMTAIGVHLDVCDACRRELALLGRVALLLEQLPPEEPPPGLWDRVAERLPAPRTGIRSWRWRLAVGLGTAAATLLLAFFAWWSRPQQFAPLAAIPSAYRTHAEQFYLWENQEPLVDHVGAGFLLLTAGVEGGN